MFLPNSIGVILFGFFVGWNIGVNLISSQSYLLSVTNPLYGVYTAIAGNLLFALFLTGLDVDKIKLKFSKFAFASTLPFFGILILISFPFVPDFYRALVWFCLGTFGVVYFRWMGDEIAIHHLDPARSRTYFFYLATAREVGSIAAFFTLRVFTTGFSPIQMIYVSSGLLLLLLIFLAVQFFPKKNIQIRIGKKVTKATVSKNLFRSFMISLVLMAFALGAFRIGEEYFLMLALKENLVSFSAIKDMQANYFLIASLLIITLGPLVGRFIKRRRPSPINLLTIQSVILLGMVGLCFYFETFYLFIGLEIVRLILRNTILDPGHQMVFSSFIGQFRGKIISIRNIFFYGFAGLPLVFLFFFMGGYTYQQKIRALLVLMFLFLVVGIWLTRWTGKTLVRVLYSFIESTHKAASIVATHAMSYLRPRNYSQKMEEILKGDPKKLLRKTVILGLGYVNQDSALQAILKEFKSENEEIQIAVLDALRVSRNYQAIQFMVKILTGQIIPKTLNVRMNATALIAGIYGKKAIPFLLNGLDDKEPRIVANTLETLSTFKDKKLVPNFEKFLSSKVPRVRMNALMGLASIHHTKQIYQNKLSEVLTGGDPAWVASGLYVVGKLRDQHFKTAVLQILDSPLAQDTSVKSCLAWALTQLKDNKGFEIFGELFSTDLSDRLDTSFMHFFSQLPQETRFDLINYLVRNNREDRPFLTKVGTKLKQSVFEFHREIEYLGILLPQNNDWGRSSENRTN